MCPASTKECGAPKERGGRCTQPPGRGTPREWGPCEYHSGDFPEAAPAELPTPIPAEGEQIYIDTVKHLDRLNLYNRADEQLIVSFVLNVIKMRKTYKRINEEGWIDKDPKNDNRLRKHPAAQLLKEATSDIKKLGNSLGLSPNARSQISIPERDEEEQSEMGQLLQGKPKAK